MFQPVSLPHPMKICEVYESIMTVAKELDENTLSIRFVKSQKTSSILRNSRSNTENQN